MNVPNAPSSSFGLPTLAVAASPSTTMVVVHHVCSGKASRRTAVIVAALETNTPRAPIVANIRGQRSAGPGGDTKVKRTQAHTIAMATPPRIQLCQPSDFAAFMCLPFLSAFSTNGIAAHVPQARSRLPQPDRPHNLGLAPVRETWPLWLSVDTLRALIEPMRATRRPVLCSCLWSRPPADSRRSKPRARHRGPALRCPWA
jgi:hypothetical protein